MTKTTNYQLNQWGENDYVKRADFNADNQKIDAAIKAVAEGGIKLVTGSYVGTGSYGASNPNTLTFSFTPKLVLIRMKSQFTPATVLYAGEDKAVSYKSPTTGAKLLVRTNGNSISWYHNGENWHSSGGNSNDPNAPGQLNMEGETYLYIAIG